MYADVFDEDLRAAVARLYGDGVHHVQTEKLPADSDTSLAAADDEGSLEAGL